MQTSETSIMKKRFLVLSLIASILFLAEITPNLASNFLEGPLQNLLGTQYKEVVIGLFLLAAVLTGFLAFKQYQWNRGIKDAVTGIQSQTPIIHGFGRVWSKTKDKVGSPPTADDIEKGANLTLQVFQKGFILALDGQYDKSCDGVYVFLQKNHDCYRIEHQLPEFATEALEREYNKSGLAIDEKFSGYYWRLTSLQLPKRLGLPRDKSFSCFGAYQKFLRGMMIWVSHTNDVFVLYVNESTKSHKWLVNKNVKWWRTL